MHWAFVPSRSGVHRFACEMDIFHCEWPLTNTTLYAGLALYRALLRQCSPSVAGDALCRDETKFLVKQRFQKYKRLQSPSQIANALRAGYEVSMGKLYPDIFAILISRCLGHRLWTCSTVHAMEVNKIPTNSQPYFPRRSHSRSNMHLSKEG